MQTAFTPERLLALAASLRVWALALLAWLAETFDHDGMRSGVGTLLDDAERMVRAMVVLMALHRLDWPPNAPVRSRRPAHAPPGFALRRARDTPMRNLTRRLLPRERRPMARIKALLALLERLETAAARLAPRLSRLPPQMRLMIIAPPAPASTTDAHAAQPASADTS